MIPNIVEHHIILATGVLCVCVSLCVCDVCVCVCIGVDICVCVYENVCI